MWVQRFTMVGNLDFSPIRLTGWETRLMLLLKELSLLPILSSEDRSVRSCVHIPARGRPLPLVGTAVASLLVPS